MKNIRYLLGENNISFDRHMCLILPDTISIFTPRFIPATMSSFTPRIKTEPLSDSDSEVDVESRIERFPENSNYDTIPQLERMDIPPMSFKIDEIYSIDEKRAAFNDLDLDPNVTVEEVKTCRK